VTAAWALAACYACPTFAALAERYPARVTCPRCRAIHSFRPPTQRPLPRAVEPEPERDPSLPRANAPWLRATLAADPGLAWVWTRMKARNRAR
jgi:hypothetical protein